MTDFFVKCNMVICSELEFIKHKISIKLPFYFHIKDVSNSFLYENNINEIEYYGKDIYFQNEDDKKIEVFKSYLKYIDLNQLTLEIEEENNEILEYTKVYKNSRIFKDIDKLYEFLVNFLGFTEVDFSQMRLFIQEQQYRLVSSFTKMVEKELEVNSNKKDPNEVFMILRCTYELNHSATVFPENKDKSISEYSFRELKVQRAYIGRKCEIEKIQYDEIMKGNKNNKRV